MAYQSIFTPNSQKDFSQDFKPGQYAKVNAGIAKNNPQNSLLNTPQQPANTNTLFSKLKHVAVDVGKAGEKTGAAIIKPVADVATGKGGKAVHDTAQLGNDLTGGTAGYFAENDIINPAKQEIAQATGNKKALAATNQKKNTDLGLGKNGTNLKGGAIKLAGNSANAALMLVGGGELNSAKDAAVQIAKTGVKDLTEQGGKQVAKTLGKKVATDATIGSAGGVAQTYAQNPNATRKEAEKSAEVGALIGGSVPVAGKVFGMGAKAALSRLKTPVEETAGEAGHAAELPKEGMTDVMTPEQTDKAAAAAYTKITPKDESAGAEEVGVKTPVRPGIKQQSTTYKVGVRTPTHPGIRQESSTYNVGVRTKQSMTDEQYTKEFTSLSKAYDKEMKSVEGKPPTTQKALAGHIDNKYQVLIGDLNDRYKNGYMSDATKAQKVTSETSPAGKSTGGAPKFTTKRVASETSQAEKPTGGAPKSGVNVRSEAYKVGARSKVTPEEATAKLTDAGYKPDEAKTILQDALPEKGLSMPGSKPKIGLNDESVQKSAANFDQSQAPKEAAANPETSTPVNGERAPESTPVGETAAKTTTESSNLKPLQATETSEQGVSRLGSSVRENALQEKIINKTEAEAGDLPTYAKANMKEQAQYATELVKNDPETAINIAMGRAEAPSHILPQMVYNAVEEYAKGLGGDDGAKLLLDLSRSKQVTNLTTMAQNVRAAAERDPHSPTNLINQVAVARSEKIKGGAKAVTSAIKADAKAVAKVTPKIKPDDWKAFVDGLRC